MIPDLQQAVVFDAAWRAKVNLHSISNIFRRRPTDRSDWTFPQLVKIILSRIPCRAKCSFQTFKALQSPNVFTQFSLINALANVWKSTRWVAVSFDLFSSHCGARLVNLQMYSPIFWFFRNFWFQADQNRIMGCRATIIRSTDSDFFKNDHIAPLLWFKMCLVIGCAHWTFSKKS